MRSLKFILAALTCLSAAYVMGEDPTYKLEYHLKPNTDYVIEGKGEVNVSLKMPQLEQDIRHEQTAPMKYTFHIDQVQPNGDFSIQFDFPKQLHEQISAHQIDEKTQQEIQKLKDMPSPTFHFSVQGKMLDRADPKQLQQFIDVAKNALEKQEKIDPTMKKYLQGLLNELSKMKQGDFIQIFNPLPVFPDHAIKEGDTWTTQAQTKNDYFAYDYKSEYKLTDVEEEVYVVDCHKEFELHLTQPIPIQDRKFDFKITTESDDTLHINKKSGWTTEYETEGETTVQVDEKEGKKENGGPFNATMELKVTGHLTSPQ
jgi:transcription termination factor NusB